MTHRQIPFAFAALAGLALLGACGSGDAPAAADDAEVAATPLANGLTAAETVAARQGHLKAVGKAFKTISDGLKESEPDMAAIQAAAASVTFETASNSSATTRTSPSSPTSPSPRPTACTTFPPTTPPGINTRTRPG